MLTCQSTGEVSAASPCPEKKRKNVKSVYFCLKTILRDGSNLQIFEKAAKLHQFRDDVDWLLQCADGIQLRKECWLKFGLSIITHTWISFGCLSLFMMCASERKSLGSIVPKNICFEGKGLGYETELYKSLPSRLFLSLMFAEGAVMIRRGIIFPINITSPFSSTRLTWVAIIAFSF